MARPPDADPDKTKRAILDAALHAFSMRGLSGTRIREVAQAAGVTDASVHHYFGNKEALHAACVDACFQAMFAIGADMIGHIAGLPEGDRVAAAVRFAARAARAQPDRSRFLLRAFLFEESESVRKGAYDAQREIVQAASGLVAEDPRFGRRLPVVALGVLITRLALASDQECTLISEEVGDAEAAFEAYLVAVAELTLAPRTDS